MTSAAISLLAVAMLSSFILAPHLIPTACARHAVVVLEASEGLKNIGGLRVVPAAAANAASSRTTKTVEMRAASAEQQHRDAAAEMHGMLARDYAGQRNGWVAPRRRPPIHNGEPLQEDEP